MGEHSGRDNVLFNPTKRHNGNIGFEAKARRDQVRRELTLKETCRKLMQRNCKDSHDTKDTKEEAVNYTTNKMSKEHLLFKIREKKREIVNSK